ncbi:hypothetical protein J2754_000734 [Halarchaeum solikamskense]|uniref:hypothetical protein n=1 Tax=Halarchaeum nitratireducens TaxID=489913 RepID=UPI001FDA316E|nr:hypothetical protein [Halarchaeum solikamskense]MBP2250437.1 hypothetical protein [Halarchaeum solikamskense]
MSDNDTGPQDLYTPAQQREHLDAYGIRDPLAHPNAGIVQDPLVNRFLGVLSNSYDPTASDRPGDLPGRAEDLDEVERISAVSAAERHREALADGDMQTLKHLTGQQDQRADVSGIKAIGKIDDLVTGPAPVICVIGEMGAGKSDFAGLLGQRWVHHHPGTMVASNIRTLQEKTPWPVEDDDGNELPPSEREHDGWIPNYPTLMDWVKHEGNPLETDQTPKLFIGDEFSSAASGTGKEGHQVRQKMGPLVFKIRKYGGCLIYIGHDESSLHPMLWRVGTIVKKTSQKTAVIADRVSNGQLRGKQGTIEGIPPTDWRMETEEASEWSWTRPSGDDEEAEGIAEIDVKKTAMWTMVACREQGMSPYETQEFVPYSRTTVKSWLEEYDDGGERVDWVADVEAVIP